MSEPQDAKTSLRRRALVDPEKIRRRRFELGLTQVQVSKLSGIDPTSVSQFESGARNPSAPSLFKLAQGLNCPPADLMVDQKAPASS